MCGIVAVIGSRDASPLLLECLRQLEYRGYDSAGVATVENGELPIATVPDGWRWCRTASLRTTEACGTS